MFSLKSGLEMTLDTAFETYGSLNKQQIVDISMENNVSALFKKNQIFSQKNHAIVVLMVFIFKKDQNHSLLKRQTVNVCTPLGLNISLHAPNNNFEMFAF